MFYFDIHSKMCLGYNVLALMAEINSFFLHSRKLLQMLEVDYSHWLYRTVCYVNLVTFASCRGWSCSRIVYGMFIEGHMVPPMYFYVLCVSMFIMCGINLVLFWRLFKNDVVRYWRESSKSHEKTAHLNGNNNQPKHVKSSWSLKLCKSRWALKSNLYVHSRHLYCHLIAKQMVTAIVHFI